MATQTDNVRVEVAFSADPTTTTPAFIDMTSRVLMRDSITISRGRSEDFEDVQVGECSLTFDNTDGALTAGRAASPYYPNVKPQNRVRVSYRDPTVAGNMMPQSASDFEDGTTGGWVGGGSVPPVLSNSTLHFAFGSRGLQIAWGTGGVFPSAIYTFSGFVIGRTYSLSAFVWVGTGNPALQLVASGLAVGAASTTFNALQRIFVTFTATQRTHDIAVWPATAPTAGQLGFVDFFQLDEGTNGNPSPTVGPPPINYRFDGYVDKWPTEWPGGGDTEAVAHVTAFDLQGRLSRTRKLGSVIAETIRSKAAAWHFPLDEPADSTTVGERLGSGSTLALAQLGVGGAAAFAGGTGPPTDGNGAILFSPASAGNGLYLTGSLPAVSRYFTTGCVLQVVGRTATATRAMTMARYEDGYGFYLSLGFDSTGHATCTLFNPWVPTATLTVTSATVFADNSTHLYSAEVKVVGATLELSLYVDAASRGTPVATSASAQIPDFFKLSLASSYLGTDVFTGTISHAAGYFTQPSAADRTELFQSTTTGFAGERSDQRIARILKWLGIPTSMQVLDVGVATIAHIDCTDKGGWEYAQDVATTEAGLVFISTDGNVTFYARGRSYNTAAAVDLTLPATVAGPSVQISTDSNDVVNDVTVARSGGATVRVTDPVSQTSYGVQEQTLELLSSTDADAFNRANWILGLKAQPMPRLPQLEVDALTEPTTAAAARKLDIGKRIALTSMAAQANASSYDLRVQGYQEVIGNDGWMLTTNTTPFLLVPPMIADDPVYGVADANNRAVY